MVGLNFEDYVVADPRFYRPSEVDLLVGNSQKARSVLGWKNEFSFPQLVEEMVKSDLDYESQLLGKYRE